MKGSRCYWCKLWSYTLCASIFKEFCKGSAEVPWLFSEAGCYQEKPEGKSNPQTEISNMENQALEEAGSKYTHNLLIPCHWLLASSTVKCTSVCTETLCKASAGYNYSTFSCCISVKQHTAGTYSRLLMWHFGIASMKITHLFQCDGVRTHLSNKGTKDDLWSLHCGVASMTKFSVVT